jgi:hypothetical protein
VTVEKGSDIPHEGPQKVAPGAKAPPSTMPVKSIVAVSHSQSSNRSEPLKSGFELLSIEHVFCGAAVFGRSLGSKRFYLSLDISDKITEIIVIIGLSFEHVPECVYKTLEAWERFWSLMPAFSSESAIHMD